MNSIQLIGRACTQPSLKYVGPTNRAVSEFTLACDDPHNKDANGKSKTYFFYIVIWGQKAEVANGHITKGQRIGITGRIVQEEFIPKGQDKPVQKTRIIAENFDLLDRPQGTGPRDSSTPPANEPSTTPPLENDIPF